MSSRVSQPVREIVEVCPVDLCRAPLPVSASCLTILFAYPDVPPIRRPAGTARPRSARPSGTQGSLPPSRCVWIPYKSSLLFTLRSARHFSELVERFGALEKVFNDDQGRPVSRTSSQDEPAVRLPFTRNDPWAL